MKNSKRMIVVLGLLSVGLIFLGFKYFDAVFLVNDMQSAIDYKDGQIETLQSLFMCVYSGEERSVISSKLKKSFKKDSILKEFDDRIEINEIVIVFKREVVADVLTLQEFSILEVKDASSGK